MNPTGALWRTINQPAQLRLDEARRRGDFFWGAAAGLRIPHGSGRRSGLFCQHEGLGRTSLAGRDCGHGAARRDGSVFCKKGVMVTGSGVGVSMLDQEPVRTLAAVAVAAHAHEYPAAVQPFTLELKLEVAGGERALGWRADRLPISAIP